jgi:ATP-dependent DNA helicase RecG
MLTDLEAMIRSGETLDVEFKGEEHSTLTDDELVETVVCLANRSASTPG